MSYAVPIYYDLHDIMHDAADRIGDFRELDIDIANAVQSSLELYTKYYDFMDALDVYYIALILNPRYKTRLLEQELGEDASLIIENIKNVLNQQYPAIESIVPPRSPKRQTLEARLLSKIQSPSISSSKSDINRYFDDPIAQIDDSVALEPNWLFNWWKLRKSEYPCMAAAARDYLAIPASEVACERLFSAGRDMIGLRRFSLNPSTMRQLSLLRASIRQSL
jgi:hAT family C-terminal dimerisation region